VSGFYPPGFEDLEDLSHWSLPTEKDRALQRFNSGYADLERVYEAVHPRLAEIVKHLDQFPLAELPPDSARLMLLVLSLAEIAPAVEFYKQPRVYDGFDLNRFTIYQ
jgi:hypothetical protein